MIDKQKRKQSWLWGILILLFFTYSTQGFIFSTKDSLVSKILVMSILLCSGYGFLKILVTRSIKMPTPLKAIFFFWLLLAVTYVVSPKEVYSFKEHKMFDTFQQFKAATVFFFSVYPGYLIGRRMQLPSRQLLATTLLLTIMCIVSFIANAIFVEAEQDRSVDADGVTNNSAYTFLYLIPFAMMIIKQYRRWALVVLVATVVFVMFGAKRGAIICMVLMGIYYLWWSFRYNHMTLKHFVSILIVLLAVGGYMYYSFTTNAYLQDRLDQTMEGDSSSRDVLYALIFNSWKNADQMHQLIGYGSCQSIYFSGNYAHNDWLELLIDNGIVGVVMYAAVFFSLFRYMHKQEPDAFIRLPYMLIVLLWFAETLFSMGYYSVTGGLSIMLMGLQIGYTERCRVKKPRKKIAQALL